MSDETPATPNAAPPVAEKVDTISADEFAAIEKELETARTTLVSEDVSAQIAKAKADARAEAEKEFATNQEIANMKAQLEAEKAAKQELERKSAEQIEAIKSKLNSAISSQAVSTAKNPFDRPENTPESSEKQTAYEMIDSLSQDEMDRIEKESLSALLNHARD